MNYLRLGLVSLVTAASAALFAPSANAVVIAQETFQLTSDHCDPQGTGCLGGAASAGTVTVSVNDADLANPNNPTTLSFDVSLNSGFNFVNGGFGAGFGFNLNGDPTINYTGVSAGFTPVANPESAGNLHMDGTGFFEYGLNCTGCGNGASPPHIHGPLDFTIDAGAPALKLCS